MIITPSLGSIEMDIQTISNRKLDDVYFGVIWLVQPQAKQPEYVHTYRHTHTYLYIYIIYIYIYVCPYMHIHRKNWKGLMIAQNPSFLVVTNTSNNFSP